MLIYSINVGRCKMLNTINGIAKCKHLMVCESRCINNGTSYVTDTGSYMQMKKNIRGVGLILNQDIKKCVLEYCQML